MENNYINPNEFLTIYQFCQLYPAFREGGMRSQVFNENSNGLAQSGAIVRIGRKILINVPFYFEWVKAKNKEKIILPKKDLEKTVSSLFILLCLNYGKYTSENSIQAIELLEQTAIKLARLLNGLKYELSKKLEENEVRK